MGLLDALSLVPLAILVGFAFFAYAVKTQLRGQWLWLRSWGDRLNFYLWPSAPGNVVRLVDEHGRHLLFFDAPVLPEREGSVIVETPIGWLRSPLKASSARAITDIHGRPGPYELALRAAAGLGAAWAFYYYTGVILANMGFLQLDSTFAIVAMLLLVYPMVWWSVASRTSTEYWAFAWAGLAPPFIYAEPLVGDTISPMEYTRIKNRPVVIRVTRYAREALEEVKRSLGLGRGKSGKADTTAAAVLGIAELYELLIRKAADIKARATRVNELLGSFRGLEIRAGKITIGKVALYALFFAIGVFVGIAISGGGLVIGPPATQAGMAQVPGNATHTIVHVITPTHTASPTPAHIPSHTVPGHAPTHAVTHGDG